MNLMRNTFLKKSRQKSTALKTFLMDNAVVVGVGIFMPMKRSFMWFASDEISRKSHTKPMCLTR